MTAPELVKEVDEIYATIKEPLDRSPEGLMGELETRGTYLARSAEILADAGVILDTKRGQVAELYLNGTESWNLVKSLIEAKCSEEKRLYVLAERLNATISHQLDVIRSMLSFAKSEMNLR
jgi:hypothetical protein